MELQDKIAAAVRRACLAAGREAFEDAGLRGLCMEGRVEAAFAAIEDLDLVQILKAVTPGDMSVEEGKVTNNG